ncbi:unnamed protein product [Caenorhabditis auriculariae]|uniref:Protein RIC1 homolog n=1 Tax=Caenorhabditis auriculariae TaxID=2777116 RepID=A0A8S1HH30_9PELO|nr:unnamed protein product [Caenorhabditis auriculariae]
MYIPRDREVSLHLPTPDEVPTRRNVNDVAANREKSFVAVATDDTIYIWLAYPQLLLCSVGLSESEVSERGTLRKIYWRFDSGAIAVSTTRNQILVYSVLVSEENCYNLHDSSDVNFQRTSQELFLRGSRPIVNLLPSVVINLAAPATCCVSSKDEILVCVRNGFAHHVTWNGVIDPEMSFRLSSVPFAHDQLQSKPDYVTSKTAFIADAVYAPLIGGYCIILSDGRAALLTSADALFRPNSLLGVWALNLRDAVCCDVNHKFRLLVFGCKNGDVCAYNLDDANGSLVQTFRVSLRVTNGPELSNRLGPVSAVRMLPNGSAFSAVWEPRNAEEPGASGSESGNVLASPTASTTSRLPPTLAIFTPFGAQSFCSLESLMDSHGVLPSEYYTSMEWGPEGLQLWLGRGDGLAVLPIVHSAACGNPVMEHTNRAVFLSESQVLISPARERETDACAPHAVWSHINVPHEYLAANWPLRFVSTDREFRHLVVAGQYGIAHCSLSNNRWKIFGNESQERDLLVTGGVFIYGDTAGVACCSASEEKPQIRFYPLATKLDNRHASRWDLEARAILLAHRGDVLAVFDTAARVLIYKLSSQNDGGRDSYVKVSMELLAEIRMRDLIAHPACVVSLQLTQLNLDARQAKATFAPSVDTVLVNVSGRLITLNANPDDENGNFMLNQPMVVASFVEQMWHDRAVSSTPSFSASPSPAKTSNGATPSASNEATVSPHLSNALWIACGAKGIKVWLPLLPGRRSAGPQEMTFIAKRIMLPFELDIYPIVICASDCLAVGVESSPQQFLRSNISMYVLNRNSEVFVHHLLRQLLKRNLGVFALEVAASCRTLPHFSHALELLLHGVLEEEATSSEPIPDPLLPRCVAFIQEFPEFLRTVAHCARKTELALWSALFAVTGSPNDLFEVCLRDGQLDTAASYLIVLQNIENSQTSMEQAARLLREALTAGEWSIARDMMRFTRAIDSGDIDSPSRTPPPNAKTTLSRRPTVSSPTPINEGANDYVFNRFQAGAMKLNKVRHSHSISEKETQVRKDSAGSANVSSKTRVSRGQSSEMPSPVAPANPMAKRMEEILEEHAWHLLNEYCIRDLGYFWAELGVDLTRLLGKRRQALSGNTTTLTENDKNCCFVEDFSLALTRLHSQFAWPYPVAGSRFVHQLEKKLGSLKISHSTASLNGLAASELTKVAPPTEATEHVPSVEAKSIKPTPSSDDAESSSGTEIQEVKLERVVNGPSTSQRQSSDLPTISSRPTTPGASTGQQSLTNTPSDSRSLAGDWQATEVLVGESSRRGDAASQAQLDYMLDLFAESSTVDWMFLLCVLRRDDSRLRKEINASTIEACGRIPFTRVRNGCHELMRWALVNCIGYVSLLQTFGAHLDVVAEQSGIANLRLPPKKKIATDANATQSTTPRTSRADVSHAKSNLQLGAAFADKANGNAAKSRHRSRSVDRISAGGGRRYDHVVSSVEPNEEGCLLM